MTTTSLYGPVQADLALVEETLAAVCRVDHEPLAKMLELALSGAGKRIRPALVLLAGTFGHYRLDLLVPLAASVELLHTATLVHDDVIDNSEVRRGRPTVNKAFQNSIAVMVGDYMFAHAAELVTRTGSLEVVKLFAHTLMVMAKGEIGQDVRAYDVRQDVQEYLARIAGKTASLFATACQGGAMVAQVPEPWAKALWDYGHHLGMAFQIVDDVLDFTGNEAELGKPVGSDLLQGTLTLPSLLLMQRWPDDNPVQRYFQERRPELVAEAVAIIRASDIPEECHDMARRFGEAAKAALTPLPATAARRTLEGLVDYILQRRS
jgi:octaprenyl-diphosphate synthase